MVRNKGERELHEGSSVLGVSMTARKDEVKSTSCVTTRSGTSDASAKGMRLDERLSHYLAMLVCALTASAVAASGCTSLHRVSLVPVAGTPAF